MQSTTIEDVKEFDFMRCRKCGRISPKPEYTVMLDAGGQFCPCGSAEASPSNPRGFEWFSVRQIHFFFLRLRGQA